VKVKVYHNDQEINWRIPKDSFPDITTAYKGDGYFDFEVEPLSFKINNKGLDLQIDDIIVVTSESGKVLINGFIDELGDELSNPIEITVFPQSLKLKDIIAGTELVINEDPKNPETAIDYKTDGYKSIRDIIQDLTKQASEDTSWEFSTTNISVPDPEVESPRYFGNKLGEIIRGKMRIFKDEMHFRSKDGVLYLVSVDQGFIMKTLAEKGEWLSTEINVPINDVDLVVTQIEKGKWLNFSFSFPPWDIKKPGVGAYYDIYRCEFGGATHVERREWLNSEDSEELPQSIDEEFTATYGEKTTLQQYGNIENIEGITTILSEMGFNLAEVFSIIDTDPFNTYALVKAHNKTNDIFGRDMFISLENSTDFYYKVHYRNKSIMDILKDLAIVTNRYVYIDSKNKIYLLPRSTSPGTITIKRNQVLRLQKNTSNQGEISVAVNRYTENDKGEPSTYGIKLRDNEWANIESGFKETFAGKKIEYSWKVLNAPSDMELAKEVIMDNVSYGIIIRMSRDRLNNTVEFTTEVYHV